MPMPVLPAMQAGTQPPLGVTETTQPSLSAVSMDVVPAAKSSKYFSFMGVYKLLCWLPQFFNRSLYGFTFPSNGYGSPGPIFGLLRSGLISFARSFAYSFESSSFIGSSGAKAGSP